MKRALLAFICVCVCVAICGCGKRESGNGGAPGAEPTRAPEIAPEAVIDDINTFGAPASYQATWTSNTEKTVARVNASVDAPDKAAYDIYEVARRNFSDDEITMCARALFGAEAYGEIALGNVASSGKSDFAKEIRRFVTDKRNAGGNYAASMFVIQSARGDLTPGSARIEWSTSSVPGEAFFRANALSRIDAPDVARGDSHTPAQARAIAEGLLEDMGINMRMAAFGVIGGALAGAGLSDPNSDIIPIADKQAYWFAFTRVIDGVQITYTTDHVNSTDDMREAYARPFAYETLNIVISDGEACAFEYYSPYDIKGVIGERARILRFDEICNIAKAILPLAYASFERAGGTVEININRITLGYARVNLKSAPDQYALVPAWDFFGTVHHARASDTAYKYESLLTINAIDGTVIDRNYGY